MPAKRVQPQRKNKRPNRRGGRTKSNQEAGKKAKKKAKYFKCERCRGYFKICQRKSHDCKEPTEAALLTELDEDGKEAWLELRRFATSLGEQRVYASAKAIMFSRRICYFFVRPKRKGLELCLFLNRAIKNPLIKRSQNYSKTKIAHTLIINHRDYIETPLTDWIKEAWELAGD